MHKLTVKDKKLYLDGFEVEGVKGYCVSEKIDEVPKLQLDLLVNGVLLETELPLDESPT